MCDMVAAHTVDRSKRGWIVVGSRPAIPYGRFTMRVVLIALATLAVGLAEASPARADARSHDARVERGDIRVGDLLQAVRDVSLDEAVIAEGSKVSVSGKRSASGRVLLDVALADGHVVRGVPLAEIRKSFRRVDP